MSIFKTGQTCVFSEVLGLLTFEGKPVQWVEITRTSEWQKKKVETTVSDESGRFHFDSLFQVSASKLVPFFSEFVASQSMTVNVSGENYEIWSNAKRDADENSELGGQAMNLKCEVTDELRLVEDYGTLLVTNCSW